MNNKKTFHDGDCTIYASLSNDMPEAGICTCGYGHQKRRKDGKADAMYSAAVCRRLQDKEQPEAGAFTKENKDFIKDANKDFQANRVEGNCIQDYVRALRELGKACIIIDQRDEKIKQLQAELKEQPEAGAFTKRLRDAWAAHGWVKTVPDEALGEACDEIDQRDEEIKQLQAENEQLAEFIFYIKEGVEQILERR